MITESEQGVQRHRADAARSEEAVQRSLAEGARSVAEVNEKKAQSETVIREAVSRFLTHNLLSQADSSRQIAAKVEPNPFVSVRQALDLVAEKIALRLHPPRATEAVAFRSNHRGATDPRDPFPPTAAH